VETAPPAPQPGGELSTGMRKTGRERSARVPGGKSHAARLFVWAAGERPAKKAAQLGTLPLPSAKTLTTWLPSFSAPASQQTQSRSFTKRISGKVAARHSWKKQKIKLP